MAFVNELISDEDKQRFDFSAIRRPPLYLDPVPPREWTVDRDRDVFLMWTRGSDQDDQHAIYFVLGWRGELLPVSLEREAIGAFREHTVTTWRLRWIGIPPRLEPQRNAILLALKDALTEYKYSGLGVAVASHEAKFEF